MDPRVWRTWDGPHVLVVGAVGKEKAVAEIGVEDGAVVGEPPVHHGVRIRDRAPLPSTQPTPRKGRQEQNLRLGLSRADLRDEACVAGDERSQGRLYEQLSKQQPSVWSYVAYSLFESEPGLKLPQEDQGELALVMKTVIQALDASVCPIKH